MLLHQGEFYTLLLLFVLLRYGCTCAFHTNGFSESGCITSWPILSCSYAANLNVPQEAPLQPKLQVKFWFIDLQSRNRGMLHFVFKVWQVQGFTLQIKVKVKVSCNRPFMTQRVPGGLGCQIFMTFGTWKRWGCQPHAPAAFTPRKCFWYSFSLGAESAPGPWYSRKEICSGKIQWHRQESIPGPSG